MILHIYLFIYLFCWFSLCFSVWGDMLPESSRTLIYVYIYSISQSTWKISNKRVKFNDELFPKDDLLCDISKHFLSQMHYYFDNSKIWWKETREHNVSWLGFLSLATSVLEKPPTQTPGPSFPIFNMGTRTWATTAIRTYLSHREDWDQMP